MKKQYYNGRSDAWVLVEDGKKGIQGMRKEKWPDVKVIEKNNDETASQVEEHSSEPMEKPKNESRKSGGFLGFFSN